METKIYIVDGDPEARDAVAQAVATIGLPSEEHETGEAFLQAGCGSRPGCVVSAYRLPGMSGLQLLERLRDHGCTIPVIMLTAFGRIPIAVQAMQSGAVTVLEKPCAENDLLRAVHKALEVDRQRRAVRQRCVDLQQRMASLTTGETLVLDQLLEGRLNKEISTELQISMRTVEKRRHAILAKMQAENTAHLVRLVLEARRGPN